jgi:hypothetical protein
VFPGDQSDHEPPRRIGFAADSVGHRGYPFVKAARPCRAVLLGPCVLDPLCLETIHGGSLSPHPTVSSCHARPVVPAWTVLVGVVYGFAIGRAQTVPSDAVGLFCAGAACRSLAYVGWVLPLARGPLHLQPDRWPTRCHGRGVVSTGPGGFRVGFLRLVAGLGV